MKKGIKVLSLFDGMGCGKLALDRAGIEVSEYYASEVDKWGILTTKSKIDGIIHLGDVRGVKGCDLPEIDLVIGGSPCQSFSFAGKRQGMSAKGNVEILTLDHYLELKEGGFEFEGQSYLFWEYMRILREVKPRWFLLENVEMGEKWERVLSGAIGVNGIHINSALVSAQNRKRIYWTNIGMVSGGLFGDKVSVIKQPKDRGILLRDVLEKEVDEKYFLSDKMLNYFSKRADNFNSGKVNIRDEEGKSTALLASMASCDISDNFIKVDTNLKVSGNQDKASCFTAGGNSGGNHSDMDLIVQAGCLKFGRTDEAKKIRKQNMANGKDTTPFADKEITGVDYDKTNTLTTVGAKDNLLIVASRGGQSEDGMFTEQQLEPRFDGKTNCLTSVQKDNYVVFAEGYEQDNRAYFEDGKSGTLDVKSGRQKVIQINPSNESNGQQPFQQNRVYDTNGKNPSLAAQLSTGSNAIAINIFDDYNGNFRTDEKTGTLTQNVGNAAERNGQKLFLGSRIRRLTPIECCRLQTVEDSYFFKDGKQIVSNNQMYKMLGNGWTIDVVAHIFSYLKEEIKNPPTD